MMPQVIGVQAVPMKINLKKRGYDRELVGTVVRCPLLLTCKEAREETLKWKENWNEDAESAKIYTNHSVDTLWVKQEPRACKDLFSSYSTIDMVSYARRSAVLHSLAVNANVWYGGRPGEDFAEHNLMTLHMDEVIIVVRSEVLLEHDVAVLVEPRGSVQQFGLAGATWEGATWEEAANNAVLDLSGMKFRVMKGYQKQLRRKSNVLYYAKIPTADTLNTGGTSLEDLEMGGFRDCSSWKVPGELILIQKSAIFLHWS